ncbi:MAG TPA: DNA polymerase III subunit delta [Beijerinckiaceae bacterium]|nr:DNA polymerase III subunit delta [Beijerinckiaceae bacterium]
MTAVKAGAVEAALRRLDPAVPVLLFYGPDAGLVAERARAAASAAVDDPADPFQLIRLEGEAVAGDPGRLADEAGTIGLFGTRRAIWVRIGGRTNLAPALAAVLDMPLSDTRIVVEAGELTKSSPLRTLCERSPRALALPCYADEGEGLDRVVDETLRAAGLAIGREARATLVASLGGDRLATRSELAKLVLYAHGRREVTVEDVDAVVSDVSGLAIDAVIDAAFGGRPAGVAEDYRRLEAEGTHPSVVLGAALRHALGLLSARIEIEAGRPPDIALRGAFPRLHFKREKAIQGHLATWRTASLRRAVERLQGAILQTRQLPDLADACALDLLLKIAARGR